MRKKNVKAIEHYCSVVSNTSARQMRRDWVKTPWNVRKELREKLAATGKKQ